MTGPGEVKRNVGDDGKATYTVPHPEGKSDGEGNTGFTFTEEELAAPKDIRGCMLLAKGAKEQLGIAQGGVKKAIDRTGPGLVHLAWVAGLKMAGESMLKATTNYTDGENILDEAQYRTSQAANYVNYLGLADETHGTRRNIPTQIAHLEEGFDRTRSFVADYNEQLDGIGKRVLAICEELSELQKSGVAFAKEHGEQFVAEFHPPIQDLQRIEGTL